MHVGRYQDLEYVLEWYSVCAPLVHVQYLQLSVEFRAILFSTLGDIEREVEENGGRCASCN